LLSLRHQKSHLAWCILNRLMNTKKYIKNTLIGILIFVFLVMTFAVSYTVLNKDDIIQYFVNEANKQISTPIDVGEIDISLLHQFPNISIELNNVTVSESYDENKGILGKAKRISFSFSFFDLINKNYEINGLHITEADITLKINELGLANYLILKPDSTSKGSLFRLNNITGENLNITYTDQKSDYQVIFVVREAKSNLAQMGKVMDVSVSGELVSDEIRVGKRRFLNNKNVSLETDIKIDLETKLYTFTSCNFTIDQGKFELAGNVNASEKTLDLDFTGINTSFRTVNSLLSSDLSQYFQDYNSRGDVYFKGTVKGMYAAQNRPDVMLDFGAKNASFFHPKYKKQIEAV
jgi:uncharacterized protein involved in outer membrane biogenesis